MRRRVLEVLLHEAAPDVGALHELNEQLGAVRERTGQVAGPRHGARRVDGLAPFDRPVPPQLIEVFDGETLKSRKLIYLNKDTTTNLITLAAR